MPACPVCDYPKVSEKYRLKDRFFQSVPGHFTLLHCASCGLLYLDEDELGESIADFYPPGYWWDDDGGASGVERRYRDWMIRKDQLKFLKSVVAAPGNVRLLDVGCGNATFLRAALEAGFDAYGLEQSPEACRIALREVPGRVVQGDEKRLVESGERFDVLTLFHTLEHIPGPFRYLKEIQKLMQAPANLIVQVPNTQSFQARVFGQRWYGLDCPRHIYNYNTYSLLHLLGRAGYRVHRVRHFSLRDNAAAMASSLLPFFDPMSQRVRLIQRKGTPRSFGLTLKEAAYFPFLLLCQPLAWIEAQLGRGGSITVHATWEERLI